MYKVLNKSSGNVLGIEISGKIDIEQENTLISIADEILKEHEKIRLFVVVEEGVTASFKAAVTDLEWVVTHLKSIDRLAIISNNKFLSQLVDIDAKFAKHLGIGEKHFKVEDIDDAWKWIEERE